MAMQKLYITGKNVALTRLGNAMSTTYEINDGILTAHWKDEKVSMPVKAGTMLIANAGGCLPRFTKVTAPRRNDDFLMWAIGVPKVLRAHSEDVFGTIKDAEMISNYWSDYQESFVTGEGWKVATCNRPGCGGFEWLGAFVDASKATIDKAFAIEFLTRNRREAWPAPFLGRLLKARFNITDDEWAEMVSVIYASNSSFLCQ